MTAPISPAEQHHLLGEATKVVVELAPPGWDRVILDYLALGRKVNVGSSALLNDGTVTRLSPPRTLAPLFARLRSGMYAQDVGTWFSFRLLIDPPDTFTVTYDWNGPPAFPAAPEPEHFAAEQERFPRSPEHQPDWFARGLSGQG